MNKKEVIVPADDLVCLGKEKLEELIRCKDCRWYIADDCEADYGDCDNVMGMYKVFVYSNDYCSQAERIQGGIEKDEEIR